jgi:DNA polymerase-2
MLVTCFGYLGYKNARFGRIEAHEAVTALGREKLLLAKEIAERRGFEMVHAIVDSLWVRKTDMTERDRHGLLREISDAVGIPITLEGNYRWIAFVPSRMAPGVAVANRYFGLFDTGEMKTRGLEVRRSDTPPLVKKMQAEMLRALASAANSAEFAKQEAEVLAILKQYFTNLRSGNIAIEDLVISQKLSKNPADYKTNTAMAAASRALLAAGMNPQPGERVELIIVDSGAQDQAVKAIPYTAATESIAGYAADKYAELLVRAAETVLLRRLEKREISPEQSAGQRIRPAVTTLNLF